VKLTTTKATELNTINAIVYGPSGIGKTTSLKTLPEEGTTLVIFERGSLPLRESNFTVLRPDGWDDVENLAGVIGNPQGDTEIRKVLQQTKVLVIDSLGTMAEACQAKIINVSRKELTKERSEGKRDTPKGIYKDLLTQEDWGLYRKKMKDTLSAICSAPIHFIVTCTDTLIEDASTGKVMQMLNLGGKTASEVPAYFDLMLCMRDEGKGDEAHRVWQTYDDGRVRAKDASGVLDPLEPTDWTKLLKKIRGEK
jgi:hypothetical protein